MTFCNIKCIKIVHRSIILLKEVPDSRKISRDFFMDRTPLVQVIDSTPQTPPEASKTSESATSFMDNTDYHRVCDHFDIEYKDRSDTDFANKLSFVSDWGFEKSKSTDRIDMLEALKGLRNMMGLSPVLTGRELVKSLYKYIRLDNQRIKLEQEMNLLKNV